MVIASDAATHDDQLQLGRTMLGDYGRRRMGPTSAIEVYDRHGRCSFVASQTGPVNHWIYDAWEQLIADLVD